MNQRRKAAFIDKNVPNIPFTWEIAYVRPILAVKLIQWQIFDNKEHKQKWQMVSDKILSITNKGLH